MEIKEKLFIDTIRRLYLEDGHYLEIGPNEEGFGVEIRTIGEDNENYFGKTRLNLTNNQAKVLAKILMLAANEDNEENHNA